jgi:hypothetical protein
MCIISGAEDNLLSKFIDSTGNITSKYHCYILRNKPTEIKLAKEQKKKITIRVVDNKNYSKDGQLQLLKLRLDSITLASPNKDDILMLGDDDMYFYENFSFDDVLSVFEKNFDMVLAYSYTQRLTWRIVKNTGIYNGLYFRFNENALKRLEEYKEAVGGGEDGLIASVHYDEFDGKAAQIYLPKLVHIGHNTSSYFYEKGKNKRIVDILEYIISSERGEELNKKTKKFIDSVGIKFKQAPREIYINHKQVEA